MHHSRSTQLNPSRIFADPAAASFAFEATEVEFGTGLGEREVRWPKACDRVRSKHSPQKLRDSPLEVGHRDPAIDTQAFNLEEHGIVRRVWRIATEDASGRDHPHRYTTPLHRVNLNRGSLRAQREAFSRVEREGFALRTQTRSEEHTSELQSQSNLVCRLLLEKKNSSKQHRAEHAPIQK